jgi:hypothetical protein
VVATVAAFPGLSDLLTWPIDHLTEAVDYWKTIGERCYGVANQARRAVDRLAR